MTSTRSSVFLSLSSIILLIDGWFVFSQIIEAHQRMNDAFATLTAVLNEHMIVGQEYWIESKRAFFSLDKTTADLLPEHGHINLSSISLVRATPTILVRVTCLRERALSVHLSSASVDRSSTGVC